MQWLNVGAAFFEGLGLIVSPCILPVLPLVLSGSLTGSRKRPFGIIAGFILFFALLTLFSRALIQHTGLDPDWLRNGSCLVLILLGIIMLSGTLTEKFFALTAGFMRVGSNWSFINRSDGGFWGGLLFGGLVAVIWTPCAGPILAAVIVQTALQKTGWETFLTLLAFGLGAGIPMLAIALFGRQILARLQFVKIHAGLLRKALGLIIILSVVWMIYGNPLPSVSPAQSPAQEVTIQKKSKPSHSAPVSQSPLSLQNGLASPYPAPEIAGIDTWVNSGPLTLASLHGKVVLVDFWTYSCINCIRTLPYLRDWYQKYHDRGFVIIGVHTPEFEFEKDPANVAAAVRRDAIAWPVALDSGYQTWQNFHNRYWPAHYLIDKQGNVVYQSFGEGDYDVTENNIRYLLGLSGGKPQPVAAAPAFNPNETPETYFGFSRSERFVDEAVLQPGKTAVYHLPENIADDHWALSGSWKILADHIVSEAAGAALRIHFNARKVFFVMGTVEGKPVAVTFLLADKNGKKSKKSKKTRITVKERRLYDAIQMSSDTGGVLEVQAEAPGLEIYTATFGE